MCLNIVLPLNVCDFANEQKKIHRSHVLYMCLWTNFSIRKVVGFSELNKLANIFGRFIFVLGGFLLFFILFNIKCYAFLCLITLTVQAKKWLCYSSDKNTVLLNSKLKIDSRVNSLELFLQVFWYYFRLFWLVYSNQYQLLEMWGCGYS